MSTDTSENGTIKIPSEYWKTLLITTRSAYNARNAGLYEAQKSTVEHLKTSYVDLVNDARRALPEASPRHHLINSVAGKVHAISRQNLGKAAANLQKSPEAIFASGDAHLIVARIINLYNLDNVLKPKSVKFKIPLKNTYPILNSKVQDIQVDGLFAITFNQSDKTAHWQVHEGNNTVSEARKHPVAETFFSMLKTIKFTPSTGGSITQWQNHGPTMEDAFSFVSTTFGVKPTNEQKLNNGYRPSGPIGRMFS